MKLFFILFLSSFHLFALEVVVSNPCSQKAFVEIEVEIGKKISVGELTVNLLNLYEIEYEGSDAGLVSINQTPKSLEAIEILSETSLRSHGWCYTLNGKPSSLLSDEQMIKHEDSKLYWYYGYFLMAGGKWGGECLPAEKSFLDRFCSWSK